MKPATRQELFHRRNGLPILFGLISIPVLLNFRYPFDSHFWDTVLETCCMLVAISGLAIRVMTVGYADERSSRLETKGVYSLVRYPLFLGNFLLWLAPVLFLQSVWLCIIYTLMFVLYYRGMIVQQEASLVKRYGKAYADWAERTPRFLPNPFRWQKPETAFSWKTAILSEYYRLFILIGIMAGVEHLGDYVIKGTFVIDTAWASIFLFSSGMYLFVYSLLGVSALLALVLLAMLGMPKKIAAQQVRMFDGPDPIAACENRLCPAEPLFKLDPLFEPTVRPNRSLRRLYDRQRYPTFGLNNFFTFSPHEMPITDDRISAQKSDAERPTRIGAIFNVTANTGKRVSTDFSNLYRRDNVLNFSVAVFGAGMLANTQGDRNFRRWYHKRTQCWTTDQFSEFSKIFGEGKYFIPITVTSAFAYRYWQERTGNFERRRVGDFFGRTARGYAVGAPTLLLGQYVLGGDRPRDGSSYWKPFRQNHGISGHAFIGATPFITAAQMTDNYWAKSLFYTLSVLPAWSRVNDDAHYLSQALLGWYLSYLSVRAVSETEGLKPLPKDMTLFPIIESNGAVGIGFQYRR